MDKGERQVRGARDEFLNNLRREERSEMIKRKLVFSRVESNSTEQGQGRPIKDLEIYGDKALDVEVSIKRAESEPSKEEDMDHYVDMVIRGSIIDQHTGIVKLRKCLSAQIGTPIEKALQLGVLPYLIELVKQDQHPQLKVQATWCITNLATGTSAQTQKLVDKGVIPLFIQLLSKADLDLVEQAVWGLGNIAGDGVEFRDIVIINNTMALYVNLFEQVKQINEKIKEQIIWAASNLCRGKPGPDIEKVSIGINMFAEVLCTTSKTSTLIDCVWSLMAICRKATIHRFGSLHLCDRLVELLYSEHTMIQQPVAKIVSAYINNNDDLLQVDNYMTQELVRSNVIKALRYMLNSHSKVIKKISLMCLANIVAGHADLSLMVFKDDVLIKKLLGMVANEDQEVIFG